MAIWKITDKGPTKAVETKLKDEKLLESHLEDWVAEDVELLGEPLLLIGRQVIVPEVKDRLDLLALDPQGNAVVIELKRGKLKDPVDMQALRYASYVSCWGFEDFERLARTYVGKTKGPDFNFNDVFEEFCSDAGVDDVPDINSDQRIIIVGSEVKDKLGSVALWLREHNMDVKVIEVAIYREGNSLFIQPQVIVPVPVSKFGEIGHGRVGDVSQPWKADGRSWHLDKRCSPETRDLLIRLNDVITDNFSVDGPRWEQKQWIAYKLGNRNWLAVYTRPSVLTLRFVIKVGAFKQKPLAQSLGVEEFDKEESIAEKLGLPSSVSVLKRSEATDRVTLRVKEGFDIESSAFLGFLEKAYEAFPK